MSLNIKNPEAHQLATELARLRGVSVTQAVLDAVRDGLVREKERRKPGALTEELLAIAQRCAAHMQPGFTSADHADLLYDEQGMPR
jgi:antitoxin VapB